MTIGLVPYNALPCDYGRRNPLDSTGGCHMSVHIHVRMCVCVFVCLCVCRCVCICVKPTAITPHPRLLVVEPVARLFCLVYRSPLMMGVRRARALCPHRHRQDRGDHQRPLLDRWRCCLLSVASGWILMAKFWGTAGFASSPSSATGVSGRTVWRIMVFVGRVRLVGWVSLRS
jgi:hypothetical protein